MIEVRAPGKLFVAGEYAVVEPGQPSVLVGVDRFLTATASERDDDGTVDSDEHGRQRLVWARDGEAPSLDASHHAYRYVLAAIGVIERLRLELGHARRHADLRISSELDDDGRKLGLGSSAAVTVATIAAFARLYGLDLSPMERCRLALLATITVAPSASGGDVAASTFGGWIGYRSPDRAALRARLEHDSIETLLGDDWPGFEITRITPPDSLRLVVGWTGEPASTDGLVGHVQRSRDDAAHATFVADSAATVELLVAGLADDEAAALDAITHARWLLRTLGERSGIAIETPRLAALCDAAERSGAAAKPSGAGGGDCGIVLAPIRADVAGMRTAWAAADVRFLAIEPCEPTGGVDA